MTRESQTSITAARPRRIFTAFPSSPAPIPARETGIAAARGRAQISRRAVEMRARVRLWEGEAPAEPRSRGERSLDEVKSRYRQFVFHFKQDQPTVPIVRGSLRVSGRGREWTVLCNGAREQIPDTARTLGAEIVAEHAPSLSEIFVALAS